MDITFPCMTIADIGLMIGFTAKRLEKANMILKDIMT